MKTVGGFRRTRYRGLDRTGLAGYLVATAYKLVRMAKLLLARRGVALEVNPLCPRALNGAKEGGQGLSDHRSMAFRRLPEAETATIDGSISE